MENNSTLHTGPLFNFEFTPAAEGFPTDPAEKFRSAHVERLMQLAGIRKRTNSEDVYAFAAIASGQRADALKRAVKFFRDYACLVPSGLADLPTLWLHELPRIYWRARRPDWDRLPYFISRLAHKDGMLLVQFAQELVEPSPRVTTWDRLRVCLNVGLYPSPWRALKPEDRILISSAISLGEPGDDKVEGRRDEHQD